MKYVLFGTGEYYYRLRHWFSDRNVVAILDNDKKKQGTELDGCTIIDPISVLDVEYDVIVILSFYVMEMKRQLLDIGVSEEKIFHFYDLHYLFRRESGHLYSGFECRKSILLLAHDLSLGGPSLALYHAAMVLKKAGYEVVFASMIDGGLINKLESSKIPVIVDPRLQICTMSELGWTTGYDLIICNTINYNVFLSERNVDIPVIWWLHDARRYYDGIKEERLKKIDTKNMKILSVGPIPAMAFNDFLPDIYVDRLLYGVTENE